MDTINGVVHVDNEGGGLWQPGEAWTVDRRFQFGGLDDSYPFATQVIGNAIGPNGNLYIVDHFAGEVLEYTQDGALIRTIGGRGRGPGEFLGPSGIAFTDEGTIWVSDPGNVKYAVFDSEGDLIGTHRRPTHVAARRVYPMFYVPGVGVIDEASSGSPFFIAIPPDGSQYDTLMTVDRVGGPSQALMDATVRRPGPSFTHVGRHFVSRMRWALDPSGAIWTGHPEEYRLVKRSWDGDTLLVVTADHRSDGFSAEEERLIEEAMAESGLSRAEINPIKPLFRSLHVIEGGYLFVQSVQTPGEASSLFDVFDADGRYLGEIDLGFAPEPLATLSFRDGLLVSSETDDLDVPTVIGVEIDGPGF